MVPPSVVIKDGMGGRRFARSFSWSAATERLVNPIFVVINSELFQLALELGGFIAQERGHLRDLAYSLGRERIRFAH